MINGRTGQGLAELKNLLTTNLKASSKTIYKAGEELDPLIKDIQQKFNLTTPYQAYQYLQQTDNLSFLTPADKSDITTRAKEANFFQHKYQGAETVMRYGFIQDLLNKVTLKLSDPECKKFSYRIDKVLTHKVWGYLIFFSVLFLIFQAIFAWAQLPMEFIDSTFAQLSNVLDDYFLDGPLFDLITQGIVPGIGGIIIFIPQIAILFACIAILEESGYMARVVFLMDKLMRKFGLNGKSVVTLISGMSCAMRAIMATSTMENEKERLITMAAATKVAGAIGYPVALKILSPDLTHKTDVGGVALGLDTADEVREAARAMLARVRRQRSEARIEGFRVQAMARRDHAQELIVGATVDRVFGPILLFGQGGTAVEVLADRAVALPPLNAPLARAMVERTRVARLLKDWRDTPAADLDAVVATLLAVAQLLADVPELAELDINPLIESSVPEASRYLWQ